jgi:hypothetical protein
MVWSKNEEMWNTKEGFQHASKRKISKRKARVRLAIILVK